MARHARQNNSSVIPGHQNKRSSLSRVGNGAVGIENLESRVFLSANITNRDISSTFVPTHRYFDPNGGATAFDSATPYGLFPAQVRAAYGLNGITGDGTGQTIAIIDAFDNPKFVSSGLAGYSTSDIFYFNQQFGLQQFGAGGPTFTKINQSGGTSYPSGNTGWGTEIALDVEYAHVMAPKANITLVEATDNSYANLIAAGANYARSLPGVSVISMSFGGGEFGGETSYNTYFTTPAGHNGVTFVASTGDSGAPGGFPSFSQNVVAVGGTVLSMTGNTVNSETGWSGSGGGISTQISKPTYQAAVTQSATQRTIPDLSFVGGSGVAVYDSYSQGTSAPWVGIGGTSLSAPLFAGVMAVIDQGRVAAGSGTLDGLSETLPKIYALPQSDFRDITSGNNGFAAGVGYDLVTGRGSPLAGTFVADMVAAVSVSTPDLTSATDTGVSSTDNITKLTQPTFSGAATSGNTVEILSDGTVVGSGLASSGAYSITLSTPLTNGTHSITARIGTTVSPGSLPITVDTIAPTFTSATFNYATVSAQSLNFTFSENVTGSVTPSDLLLTNTTSSFVVPAANMAVSMISTTTPQFSFPGYSYGALPDGNYTASIAAANVTDVAGNALSSNATATPFFSLAGDFNHSGTVDIADLGILASNWQGSSRTFSQGDTTYDGIVDIADLGILASNWQKSLLGGAPAPQTASARGLASSPDQNAAQQLRIKRNIDSVLANDGDGIESILN